MKILVPTDFSEISVNAAHYAAALTASVGGEMVLLHGAYVQGPPHASMLKEQRLKTEIVRAAEQDCTLLEHQLLAKNKDLKVSHVVVEDYPLKLVIESFALQNGVDMVVMGTRGAGGLSKVLFGSNTSAVMGNSSLPVLAVPASARFNGIKNIVYATDAKAMRQQVKQLVPFVRRLGAHLHVLHVLPPYSRKRMDPVRIAAGLAEKSGYEKISFHAYTGEDVEEGIMEFAAALPADLLVLFTHRPAFFERLLGTSHARQMSFHLSLPLLSMKQKEKQHYAAKREPNTKKKMEA